MKEMLTRNIGIKILAVILAAILWLVINNAENPIITEKFYDIPVRKLNEQAIKSNNQEYEVLEGDKVDITFTARRTIAENLKESNFLVTADLAKVTDMNTVTIDISCPGYEDKVIIKKSSHQVMRISREEVAKLRAFVKVRIKGEPAEGFYVAKKTSNTMVTVSGPKSKIEKIEEIIAEVDVTDQTQTYQTYEYVKVYNTEGEEIDKSNLTFSQEAVPINIEIYPTKNVDIVVTTEGKPADGYFMTDYEIGPNKVEIAGKEEQLKNINSLNVVVNIEGATENIQREIDLSDFLEKDLILVDDETALVNITIEKEETKRISIRVDDIGIKNKPDLSAKIQNTGSISLELSGPRSELNNITSKMLKPFIDLYQYTYGSYEVKLQIEKIEGAENVSLINPPKIFVYLSPL
jgi:YbbR domain-containing protein